MKKLINKYINAVLLKLFNLPSNSSIVIINGGLGNQIFQYYLGLELRNIYKKNVYFYDIRKSYINTYFCDFPIHVIGYHLNNDKWYPVFDSNYHKQRAYVNLQLFFKYKEYLKKVKKRAILTLFLVHGFDANIIKNISNYL